MSFHGGYRCRHSGACCTSGWPIPVEADRLARLRAAVATGPLLYTAAATAPFDPFVSAPDAPADTPALLAVVEHQCVFYDADARRCSVQRALGHDALPLACRQFPRMSVRDPRGVSVTLSHYCPTAASLLHTDEPVSIVADVPAFPANGEYVGLDATHSLPPLLRPDVLMDWESWWEWERLSVEFLTRADDSPATALGRIGAAVERTRGWQPDDGPQIDRVRSAFDEARDADVAPFSPDELELARRVEEVTSAIPDDLRDAHPRRGAALDFARARKARRDADDGVSDALLRRFLAAHAFASWTAHLGRGLRTWLRSVEAPFVLLASGLDVREVDLRLRHLAEPQSLATTWSRTELGDSLGSRGSGRGCPPAKP